VNLMSQTPVHCTAAEKVGAMVMQQQQRQKVQLVTIQYRHFIPVVICTGFIIRLLL